MIDLEFCTSSYVKGDALKASPFVVYPKKMKGLSQKSLQVIARNPALGGANSVRKRSDQKWLDSQIVPFLDSAHERDSESGTSAEIASQ